MYSHKIYQRQRHVMDTANATHRREMVAKRRLVYDHKSKPCMDCGGSFNPWQMEFDHRNADEKLAPVSRLVSSNASLARILAEIEKCDLVCANCHKERTHKREQLQILRSLT